MPTWLKKFVELNPVLVRGVLVAVAALLAQIVGNTVIEEELINTIIDTITALAALITALWARGKVIAENKVIAWKVDPTGPDTIVPGPVTIQNDTELHTVYDAAVVSLHQDEARASLKKAA